MRDRELVEDIWVNVAEGAEATGFHPDHVRRLARQNSRMPEDKRFIRIRMDSRAYELWLPDLMHYLKNGNLFPNSISAEKWVEGTWVNTTEAAEITGYNANYLQQIAQKIWRQPEDERAIKLRNRSGRYELWLPDLITYIETARRGRPPKGKPKN